MLNQHESRIFASGIRYIESCSDSAIVWFAFGSMPNIPWAISISVALWPISKEIKSTYWKAMHIA